jgi:hypothetical protein
MPILSSFRYILVNTSTSYDRNYLPLNSLKIISILKQANVTASRINNNIVASISSTNNSIIEIASVASSVCNISIAQNIEASLDYTLNSIIDTHNQSYNASIYEPNSNINIIV